MAIDLPAQEEQLALQTAAKEAGFILVHPTQLLVAVQHLNSLNQQLLQFSSSEHPDPQTRVRLLLEISKEMNAVADTVLDIIDKGTHE